MTFIAMIGEEGLDRIKGLLIGPRRCHCRERECQKKEKEGGSNHLTRRYGTFAHEDPVFSAIR
jgi:hypothetical protein